MKIFTLGLDVKNEHIKVVEGIQTSDDVEMRIVLSDAGIPINFTGAKIIRLTVRKPDYASAETAEILSEITKAEAEKGILWFVLPKSFKNTEGLWQLKISVFSDSGCITSCAVNYVVTGEERAASEEEISTCADVLTAAAEALTKEEARASAETARGNEEEARENAEDLRAAAETAREDAEQAREEAEIARENEEEAREDAEHLRETAETARISAEALRENAETAKVSAEALRENAETARANAEVSRRNAETARVSAEILRASAETAREALANKFRNMTVSASTGAAGSTANAEITEGSEAINFEFTIPKGDKGDTGDVSDIKLNGSSIVDGNGEAALTADSAPTSGSANLIQSGAVYTAVSELITVDDALKKFCLHTTLSAENSKSLTITDGLSGTDFIDLKISGTQNGLGDLNSETEKYDVPITLRGKNLFNYTNITYSVANCATYSYTNGILTGTGKVGLEAFSHGSGRAFFDVSPIATKGKTVNVSIYATRKTAYRPASSDNIRFLMFCGPNSTNYSITTLTQYRGFGIDSRDRFSKSFTANYDIGCITLCFSGAEWEFEINTLQIEVGNTVTAFEPYATPQNATLSLDEPLYEGDSVSLTDENKKLTLLPVTTNIIDVGTAETPSEISASYYQDIKTVIAQNYTELQAQIDAITINN